MNNVLYKELFIIFILIPVSIFMGVAIIDFILKNKINKTQEELKKINLEIEGIEEVKKIIIDTTNLTGKNISFIKIFNVYYLIDMDTQEIISKPLQLSNAAHIALKNLNISEEGKK